LDEGPLGNVRARPQSKEERERIGGGGTDMNKGWGIIALVVAALYWLQAVLIPLALAVLLTFLLSPVVSTLQRRGLGRVPSVLVTALLALSILGGIGWTLTLASW
jgi:predicted PurR-regulated permease PerM